MIIFNILGVILIGLIIWWFWLSKAKAVKSDDAIIRIEVKASQSKAIPSVELSANEWRAANEYRAEYKLALVGSCLSKNPVIEFIDDPASCWDRGDLNVSPSQFMLSW